MIICQPTSCSAAVLFQIYRLGMAQQIQLQDKCNSFHFARCKCLCSLLHREKDVRPLGVCRTPAERTLGISAACLPRLLGYCCLLWLRIISHTRIEEPIGELLPEWCARLEKACRFKNGSYRVTKVSVSNRILNGI